MGDNLLSYERVCVEQREKEKELSFMISRKRGDKEETNESGERKGRYRKGIYCSKVSNGLELDRVRKDGSGNPEAVIS